MTTRTNTENLPKNEIRFSLTVEKTLAFASSPNMAREVKYLPLNLKKITRRYFALLNIHVWIVRSILSLNSKQFSKIIFR